MAIATKGSTGLLGENDLFPCARYAISSGKQVVAEIHLGERTVLEYLLSPMKRAFHEAGAGAMMPVLSMIIQPKDNRC